MTPYFPDATRAVFFDAVGTLLFPKPSALVVYATVARSMGLELAPAEVRTRFLAAYRKQETADRITGWVTSEEREHDRWRAIVHETLLGVSDPEACFRELYEHFSKPSGWEVNRDAAFVLGKLQARGLVLGMGSNYDARLWSVLEGFPELAPLKERTVISAAVSFRKPAAQFFAEVVRVAGCHPAEVLFVGDDVANDYHGATAAGLNAVLLDDQSEVCGVEPRITTLRELTD